MRIVQHLKLHSSKSISVLVDEEGGLLGQQEENLEMTAAGVVDRREREKMASAARRSGGAVGTGMLEGVYRLVMRRTPIYVTFVLVGAFFGERAVDYGVHKLWERNNIGKRYEDIPVLGTRQAEE